MTHGNVTSDGTWTNAWNWRNEMTSSINGTTTVSYQYDHAGNRVQQSNGTSTTIYPNSYYDVEGADIRRHITAGALGSIATSTWDGTDGDVVYHHKDHLGGTHVETDDGGAVLEYIVYKPFGGTLSDVKSGTYENDLKYTGKEKDSDTGYYYYGARYYNADVGRFLSQDPAYRAIGTKENSEREPIMLRDPQLLNSYSYTRNNPLTYIDPDGEFIFAVAAIWAVVEVALTVSDAYTAVQTVTNPNASTWDKAISVGGLAAGLVAPGGGYGTAVSKVDNVIGAADSIADAKRGVSTLSPGPFAKDSVPATSPSARFTQNIRNEINEIGAGSGCHTCGANAPGTGSGNWVPDHQPPTALNSGNAAQQLYPHCINCSRSQGGTVSQIIRNGIDTVLKNE